jgi:hypothetical protein
LALDDEAAEAVAGVCVHRLVGELVLCATAGCEPRGHFDRLVLARQPDGLSGVTGGGPAVAQVDQDSAGAEAVSASSVSSGSSCS